MLASYGAKRFAQKHGFQEVSNDKLLAPEIVQAYQQWKQDKPDGRRINEAGKLGAVYKWCLNSDPNMIKTVINKFSNLSYCSFRRLSWDRWSDCNGL